MFNSFVSSFFGTITGVFTGVRLKAERETERDWERRERWEVAGFLLINKIICALLLDVVRVP